MMAQGSRTGIVMFDVQGLQELETEMNKLTKAQNRAAINKALRAAAKPVVSPAKGPAPVLTGKLKKSLKVSDKLNRRQAALHRRQIQDGDVDMFIGAGAMHAHFQEFGTRHHDPQPYLRQAWDGARDKVLSELKRALWENIRKAVAARAARQARRAAAGGGGTGGTGGTP
jgi:HK97 gp10 family phage protein